MSHALDSIYPFRRAHLAPSVSVAGAEHFLAQYPAFPVRQSRSLFPSDHVILGIPLYLA